MWDRPRMAWAIYWIIIGSFVQAQEFSTTVVKEGEDATIECGLQTKVAEGYLKWETMTNGSPVDLAYDLKGGHTDCDDRIINCTLYANGSIQLESVSKEDGARYYRCLRGDEDGYHYYSDHRLLVLSKEETSSPPSIETPHRESVSSFNMGKKGVLHGYNAPVCEDDVDGNLPVVCYPPSGIIVDREYETIQCYCTDSDGQMDNVTFPVTRQTSSRPSFETPHRESVTSFNMGEKGVLHGYNAPVCEDDVDGNLPVVCYPPSGIIVDREYETIQCNCTDSDGLMDRVAFPVTSLTHWAHPGCREAFISILVILLTIFVFIWICLNLCKNLKKWNTNRKHAVGKGLKQSEVQAMLLEGLREMLVTEIKMELNLPNEKSMKMPKEMTVKGLKNRDLNKLLEEKQDQKISDWNQASCEQQ
ncbi:uncharacterized protein [Apostichopus japonicus]|uniref:uncharacterized protein n=1 Tax=Stichopus japonicus TaxID=307972 RepID=UPI003AB7755A